MTKEEAWKQKKTEHSITVHGETDHAEEGACPSPGKGSKALSDRDMHISAEEEEEGQGTFSGYCREGSSLLMSAYLFVLFCIYPFYIKHGYEDIGDAKYEFYRYITLGGFALILLLGLGGLVGAGLWKNRGAGEVRNSREKAGSRSRKIRWTGTYSVTDGLVLLYGISTVLSFLCSDYIRDAFWGEDQWYMGLVSQLLFVASYFLVSRLWEWEEKLVLVFLAASSGIFLLGILNRFSIYPLGIESVDHGFLATLGNINWYCGYWSVLFPLGFMLYWRMEEIWLRLAGAGAVMLGLGTGISQGSASAFLVLGALYLFVFCLSFHRNQDMKRWMELVIWYGLCCQVLRLWRILIPTAFTYYESSLSGWMTSSGLTGWVTVGMGLLYLIFCLAEKKKGLEIRNFKMLRQILLLILGIGTGIYILLMSLNTSLKEGFYFLKDIPFLTFSRQWGNARGATWRAGLEIFNSLPFWKQLTGVGPDCFARHLYTLPLLAEEIRDQFLGARLTNAHNEWLTMLVNQGWIGLLSYAGIFLTAVFRWTKDGRPGQKEAARPPACDANQRWLLLFGMSAFAYMIHNMVSFQQILSTPFVFLILGMGEGLSRVCRTRQKE